LGGGRALRYLDLETRKKHFSAANLNRDKCGSGGEGEMEGSDKHDAKMLPTENEKACRTQKSFTVSIPTVF